MSSLLRVSFVSLSCFALLMVEKVSSHSWAHCTDYRAVINGQDFDESSCEGYIRDWSDKWNAPGFSQDLGINYFGSNGAWCQSDFDSDIASMYTDSYPYAEYYTGNTYRIVWPAKNHANYGCFSNIPDTSMKLFYSSTPGRTSDPTTLNSDWIELHNFQDGCTAGSDGCGFQQCPSFCDDTDGAPCFGDFAINEADFSQDGFYTFMWYWIFNGGSAAYTTCFEAYVHTDGGGSSAETPSPTSPVPSPTESPTDAPTPPTPQPTRPPTVVGGTYPPTQLPTEADAPDEVGTDYFIIIPLCYDGAAYDETTLLNGANNAFGANVVDFGVRAGTKIEGSVSTIFNVSIETYSDYGGVVTSIAYNYATDTSLLCDSIENEFGTGTCTVCSPGEIKLYSGLSDSDPEDVSESDDGYSIHDLYISKLTIVMIASIFLLL